MKKIAFSLICFCLMIYQQLTGQAPVQYKIEPIAAVQSGTSFDLKVKFQTAPGWYIYAPTGMNEVHGMIETKVVYENLPKGITTEGSLDIPAPKPKGQYQIYEGKDIPFVQNFSLEKDIVTGVYKIPCQITYQTCNQHGCLPPITEEVAVELEVQ